ncbi:MAG: response regulator [Halobacteriovoraceae bacterium]|nr:response regulator [Halobacteriovoraceae bacterium]
MDFNLLILAMIGIVISGSYLITQGVTMIEEVYTEFSKPFEGMRILHVDDDESCLKLISKKLGRKGANVLSVNGSQEFVDKIDGFKPQFVIFDYNIDRNNGWQLFRYALKKGYLDGAKAVFYTSQKTLLRDVMISERFKIPILRKNSVNPQYIYDSFKNSWFLSQTFGSEDIRKLTENEGSLKLKY